MQPSSVFRQLFGISEECCFGKGCFLPCSSWKAAAGIDKLVCGFQGGCHSEELWWSMRADEAVVQLPGSILPVPRPVAGLRMLLRSSQLFRTLSHSHMQGKSTVWSLDLMSLCFCYICTGVLGLRYQNLFILFIQVYADGDSSVSTYERRASLREFYGNSALYDIVIFILI